MKISPGGIGVKVVLRAGANAHELPALWLRERSPDLQRFDSTTSAPADSSQQWPPDLRIEVAMQAGDTLSIRFSDGYVGDYSLNQLRHEITAVTVVPARSPWRNDLSPLPYHMFSHLSSPNGLAVAIADVLRYGIVILTGVPTNAGSVSAVAASFGSLRDSHLGQVFTPIAQGSHGTQPQSAHPFVSPTQSYVLTHCLRAGSPHGQFTVVDGLSVVERLRLEDSEGCRLLASTDVTYRYTDVARDHHISRPLLNVDRRGQVTSIHHNPFHVELPLMAPGRTARYHAARQRFCELVSNGAFALRVPLAPGNLVVTDNRTILLDTGAADPEVLLQQCIIDADGPPSTFRRLSTLQS